MKGSLVEKPSGEKAKARRLLLSGHSMINCSASLNVCEEDDDGHQMPQTVIFTTGSPPVLHKTWKSVQDETYQSNQVCLRSTSTVNAVKGEFSHSGSAAKGILCSLLHRTHQNYSLLDISSLLQYLVKLGSFLSINATYSSSYQI